MSGDADLIAEIEQLRGEMDQATRGGDLQRAAELQYGRVPELERRLHEDEQRFQEAQTRARYLKEEVGAEDIAEIEAASEGMCKAVAEGGDYVVLSEDEIKAAYPKRTQTIELESFAKREEISFLLLDTPYQEV